MFERTPLTRLSRAQVGHVHKMAVDAIDLYVDAVQKAAGEVLARIVVDAARNGNFRDLRDDFEADPDDAEERRRLELWINGRGSDGP